MDAGNFNAQVSTCTDLSASSERIRDATEELIAFILQDCDQHRLNQFERDLWTRLRGIFRLAVSLFLLVRHERLDLTGHQQDGWRVKKRFATRTIKTICGAVTFGRAYLRKDGQGFCPLDAVLGITRDGFSFQVVDWITRLCTQMSYAAACSLLKRMAGSAPSVESAELLVIGVGRRAAAFMDTRRTFDDDGEVLVIEVDGKAAPMATEAELAARRRPRRPGRKCSCRCQRHRGRHRRKGRQKKRKTRGHNSKNGRSATLVAMYTLRRGDDGKLCGPCNKKVWGRFGSRRCVIQWVREQATRRGFPPDTDRTVQIVIDGERCLRKRLEPLFPGATVTFDLRHAQERLWKAGRLFHPEGSEELEEWVEPLNALLLDGQVETMLSRLRSIQASVAKRGPNTKSRREGLQKQIAFFEERRELMHYDEYRDRDLVLATGVIEGACRYVIGERLDCSGMRWCLHGAEPLLQLRCIALNGDWEDFMSWLSDQTTQDMKDRQWVQLRTKPAQPKSSKPQTAAA